MTNEVNPPRNVNSAVWMLVFFCEVLTRDLSHFPRKLLAEIRQELPSESVKQIQECRKEDGASASKIIYLDDPMMILGVGWLVS